ncbi:MAG: hypothetical protein NWQ54_19750 [Paraglaciecola sp.]|uniref:Stress-induced acidophilic repeat motif-containing protein n=1 Tax=Rheinheimera baltica TaxID=67576 RepID=A0ABT9I559_9GAMM|nr:hypothetical protein [Rheinheimera baltica]MDP5133122.1 hypothetical protein [Paraglaciecola sp.]MDP5138524.1 hypothetical protein [Rheinheimera baltica]MDP5149350.1 hypothetical protein [Rheinheimera baltica]
MTKHQSNSNSNEHKRQEREAADSRIDSKKSDPRDNAGSQGKMAKNEKSARSDGRNGAVLGEINRDAGKEKQ